MKPAGKHRVSWRFFDRLHIRYSHSFGVFLMRNNRTGGHDYVAFLGETLGM